MFEQKLSRGLAEYLKSSLDSNIEVVIELNPTLFQSNQSFLSRQQKIEQTRQSFEQALKPLEAMIQDRGGNILGAAWINQTVKARIPANCITQVAGLSTVSTIDLPRRVKRDAF